MSKTINYTAAQELTLKTKRGDTFSPPAILVNVYSGSAYNFTDFHAEMQIKENKNDETALITLTDLNGGITLASGSISLYASAEDMDIEPGDYFYDLQLTHPTGVVKTWLQGVFQISNDVTR